MIAGFVLGSGDKDFQNKVINTFIADPDLNEHSFYFVRLIKPDLSTIEKLLDLIDSGRMPITGFTAFQYGRALDSMPCRKSHRCVRKFVSTAKQEDELLLSLLFMYTYGNDDRWKELKDLFKKVIGEDNMGVATGNIHLMEVFHWNEVAKKILKEGDDPIFAIKIAEQIVEMSNQTDLNYDFEHYLSEILARFFWTNTLIKFGTFLAMH